MYTVLYSICERYSQASFKAFKQCSGSGHDNKTVIIIIENGMPDRHVIHKEGY